MATHDSSIPVDNEKAYAHGVNAGPTKREAKLKMLDLVFRFLTFACTLSAFVVMISNLQYKRPLYPVSSLKVWAKYHYSDAFMWFVVANALAFSYALLTLLVTAFNHSPKVARIVLVLDLLMTYIIMSGASAATAIAYIGKNGLAETHWDPICDRFHRYCEHVVGALAASFLGWLYLLFVLVAGFHRRH